MRNIILFYDSAMIGEIEKARQYVQEPKRLVPVIHGWKLQGFNHEHLLVRNGNGPECSCSFFQSRGICSHTMTLERLDGQSNAEAISEAETDT